MKLIGRRLEIIGDFHFQERTKYLRNDFQKWPFRNVYARQYLNIGVSYSHCLVFAKINTKYQIAFVPFVVRIGDTRPMDFPLPYAPLPVCTRGNKREILGTF